MSVRLLSLHLKLELEVQRASSLEGKTEVKWEEQGQVGPQAQAGAPADGVEAVPVLAASALGRVGGSLLPVMGPRPHLPRSRSSWRRIQGKRQQVQLGWLLMPGDEPAKNLGGKMVAASLLPPPSEA